MCLNNFSKEYIIISIQQRWQLSKKINALLHHNFIKWIRRITGIPMHRWWDACRLIHNGIRKIFLMRLMKNEASSLWSIPLSVQLQFLLQKPRTSFKKRKKCDIDNYKYLFRKFKHSRMAERDMDSDYSMHESTISSSR